MATQIPAPFAAAVPAACPTQPPEALLWEREGVTALPTFMAGLWRHSLSLTTVPQVTGWGSSWDRPSCFLKMHELEVLQLSQLFAQPSHLRHCCGRERVDCTPNLDGWAVETLSLSLTAVPQVTGWGSSWDRPSCFCLKMQVELEV